MLPRHRHCNHHRRNRRYRNYHKWRFHYRNYRAYGIAAAALASFSVASAYRDDTATNVTIAASASAAVFLTATLLRPPSLLLLPWLPAILRLPLLPPFTPQRRYCKHLLVP